MKYFVAVTDKSWFSCLASLQPTEANFWRPTASDSFRAISQGSPFLFKLHFPDDFVVGGGFFIKYEALPLSIAWESFGNKNGAANKETFHASVSRYRQVHEADPVIGCIILSEPFFIPRDQWIPVPSDWRANIVRGKTYDTQTPSGAALWSSVSDFLLYQKSELGEDLLKEAAMSREPEFGSLYLVKARLGQGAFRVLVTSAYERRCAISGEKVLPVLEAAHIKPAFETGPNRVSNGLLLRSDIHILFDHGYLTITPDLRIQVSGSIREQFHNGEYYLSYHGKRLVQVPRNVLDRPDREYLEWHNENKFFS